MEKLCFACATVQTHLHESGEAYKQGTVTPNQLSETSQRIFADTFALDCYLNFVEID